MSSRSNNSANSELNGIQQSLIKFVDGLDSGFELLELIFDKHGDVEDFIFLEVNPAYEKQTGLKAADIIGKRKKENAPASEQRWYDYAIRAVKSGKILHYEYYNNDVKKYFDTQFVPISSNKIAVLFKDITENKKAHERYEQLVNSLPEIIFEIDANGCIVFANSRASILTGYSKEELENGFDANRLVAPKDKERSRHFIRKMFAEGLRQSNEYMFVKKDGTCFPVLLISVPAKENDVVVGARTLGLDLTEFRQVQRALQESEERYHQLFSSMTEMFYVAELLRDLNGKVIDFVYRDANPAFLKSVGKKREQVVGKLMTQIVQQSNDDWFNDLDKIEKTGQPMHSEIKSILAGGYYDVYAWKANTNQVAVIFVDISQRKILEKQLHEKNRLAAIGETASMVGHDLRNPLQTIVSELFLIQSDIKTMPDGQSKASLKESLDSISEQVSYMDKIVSDLQTFVKPVEAQKQIVNIRELTDSTLAQINLPSNIHTSIDIEDHLTVETDPQLLKRILINLITNSMQAMPSGGKLAIKSYDDGKCHARILVEDTGEGIPDEVKPKIFVPLFTTKSKGQGFGLAVCKRVIEAQGGTIDFESKVGKGTKFIIELPLQK